MIVTPAQAGVQLKVVWISACAGMTNRCRTIVHRNICEKISVTQDYFLFEYDPISEDTTQ